jgi:hypothetical protein
VPDAVTEGPSPPRWARICVNVRSPLRRGAWYPVISVGSEEVVLEVRQRPVSVPRPFLDVAATPPSRWGVVPREWGGPYLVCPRCADRVRVGRPVTKMYCSRCHASFEVDGDPRGVAPE